MVSGLAPVVQADCLLMKGSMYNHPVINVHICTHLVGGGAEAEMFQM